MLSVIIVSMWLGYLLGKKRMEKLNQRPEPKQIQPPPVKVVQAPKDDIQKLLYDQHVRSFRQGWNEAIEKLTINRRYLPPGDSE